MTPEQEVFHKFIDSWSAANRYAISSEWRRFFDWSYPQWAKSGDKAWRRLQTGGTYQLLALIWYHHWFKPGSKENRPKIIIQAILEQT